MWKQSCAILTLATALSTSPAMATELQGIWAMLPLKSGVANVIEFKEKKLRYMHLNATAKVSLTKAVILRPQITAVLMIRLHSVMRANRSVYLKLKPYPPRH